MMQVFEGEQSEIRYELLKEIMPIISDQLVVCNIGLPSQELHMLDDQPGNF